MAYPGDQQQPGGSPPSQPPPSPYGPAEDQAAHGGSLFDPPPARSRGSESPNPFGGEPGSWQQVSSSGDEQGGWGAPGPQHDEPPYYGTGGGAPRGVPQGGHGEPNGFGGPGGPDHFGEPDHFSGPGHLGEPGDYGEPANDFGKPDGPGGYGGPDRFGEEPGGPGAYGGGPGSGEDDGRGPGGNRKPLIIGAGVVAGVVVIGGVALALTSGGGDDKPKAAAATTRAAAPPRPTPTPTPTETGRGDRLAGRATDPLPLTLNEVFRTKKFKGGGRTYVMTTRRSIHTCSAGVHGTAFRKALAKAGCTQVLRASFSNGKFIGTIGVLNLRTETTAAAAERASHPKDAFVVPLPGTGTTKKIGQGLSLTTAETDGHYLILSWVQYPSGKKISKADYSGVTSFVQYATLGSNLRPALNYRSMEGKPA